VSRDYPGAKVVGRFSPPFRPLTQQEENDVDDLVNAAAPDIVWVGLGAPKQDRWMASHRPALRAPVLIGVGAAFDMLAGTIARAPPFLRRTGCEWMFRVLQEPKRLASRYLQSNTKFVVKLIAESLQAGEHQAHG
jgi:N-acetylglucosaminyldiphosphoundecaprenol N-acetyl-beta-D-mannosaminyltransferase